MAKVSFPARCAVAVVCGENLISQVYPASVPIEMFLDDVVELLTNELRRRGLTGLDPAIAYQLNRANGTTLDVTKTLDELGVEDGTTLVLVPATDGEPFEPQYESLSTGLARVGKRMFQPVTAATAAHTAIAIVAMIGLDIGIFMSGAVVVESVFGWPGIGQLAWQAIQRVDIPIIMGVTLVSACGIVIGNLIADLISPLIDPRIKLR